MKLMLFVCQIHAAEKCLCVDVHYSCWFLYVVKFLNALLID